MKIRGFTVVDNTDFERAIAAGLLLTYPTTSTDRSEVIGTLPYISAAPYSAPTVYRAGEFLSEGALDSNSVPLLPKVTYQDIISAGEAGERGVSPNVMLANVNSRLSALGDALQGGVGVTGFAVIIAVDKTTPAIVAGDPFPWNSITLGNSANSYSLATIYEQSDFQTATISTTAASFDYAYFFLTDTSGAGDFAFNSQLSGAAFDTRLIKGYNHLGRSNGSDYEFGGVVDTLNQASPIRLLTYEIDFDINHAANISDDNMVSNIIK